MLMFTVGVAFGIVFSLLCIKIELRYGAVKIVKKNERDDKN